MFFNDQFSNLVRAKETGFDTIFRMADSVGDLYETKDYSDRVYGVGYCLEKSCIQPTKSMQLEDYERALSDTQKYWEKLECH